MRSVRILALTVCLTLLTAGGAAAEEEEFDPARNVPIPCEAFSTPGITPEGRSNHRLLHLANVCGVVGTDVEFQSRRDVNGQVHDYAFVGTMGAGFRIFDITDPAHPRHAGGYVDSGWENDVQVRGNIVVSTFDGVVGEGSSASTCLRLKYADPNAQGVDIFRLHFDPAKAADPALQPFTVSNVTCLSNPPGGAHNATLHPSGKWLAISDCCSDWAIDVVDLRPVYRGRDPRHLFRLIDKSRATGTNGLLRCPSTASFKCIIMRKPNGHAAWELWRPHDVFFSRDGDRAYVAAINSSWIIDVSGINRVLRGEQATIYHVPPIALIPNVTEPGGVDDPHNIQISHQADVTADEKILLISDERGGGLSETRCNTETSGVIGSYHFFALHPIAAIPETTDATPAHPVKLGVYFIPNPGLLPDVLDPLIATLPVSTTRPDERLERGCTLHVFRMGGNGTASPGPIMEGFDGVSRAGTRVLFAAAYGAGVWWMTFWHAPRDDDGVVEDPRTTWGNTAGWNVQFGADTWSAKEYKGYVYAADMLRGFDVYTCPGGPCPADPVVSLAKTGPAAASTGETVSYTIRYRNLGPADSLSARVTDAMPADLAFVSATDGGTYDSATRKVRWTLGTVRAGAGGSLTLVARVKANAAIGELVTNTATFTGEMTYSWPASSVTAVTP